MGADSGRDQLSLWIDAARDGDIEAARRLVDEFCATVRQNRVNGEPGGAPIVPYTALDERLLDFLVESFRGDSGVVLRAAVQGRRGRPASSEAREESLARGQHVHELLRIAKRVPALLRPLDAPFTVERAIQWVAEGRTLEKVAWTERYAPKFAPKSADAVKKGYQAWLLAKAGSAADRRAFGRRPQIEEDTPLTYAYWLTRFPKYGLMRELEFTKGPAANRQWLELYQEREVWIQEQIERERQERRV
ncbi:hypothetical protein [Burkholderia sp. AU6039]|uniref:hypothetical protein n=1 Tax=Burkholderia sp. AU6039 TaxID=2015344 RepID=UPI001180FA23|nr:hypothetical protein [Burkholderia sp. AU6039]